MNRCKKVLLTGVIALTPLIGAGAASAASYTYTVSSHDTMWKISQRLGVSMNSLVQSNPQVKNPSVIWPGMKLNVPARTYSQPASGTASTSSFANQVAALVNQERAKSGLKPLAADRALTVMALDKAKDMYNKGYFDHTSPTYGSPFDMMRAYGIKYGWAGENIAKGQRTPKEVMTAWMNSAGHRQNILNPHFTKIGVAYYNGEWVQEFTG